MPPLHASRCCNSTRAFSPPLPRSLPDANHSFPHRLRIYRHRICRGISDSDKSFTQHLIINQLVNLSTSPRKPLKVTPQVHALQVLLRSFGYTKTAATSSTPPTSSSTFTSQQVVSQVPKPTISLSTDRASPPACAMKSEPSTSPRWCRDGRTRVFGDGGRIGVLHARR
jgi:hypothetical protein